MLVAPRMWEHHETGPQFSRDLSHLLKVIILCQRLLRIKFPPPSPTPEFLSKDFPSATRSRTEILTKENLVGAKTAPTAVSRTFTPLVRGIRFP